MLEVQCGGYVAGYEETWLTELGYFFRIITECHVLCSICLKVGDETKCLIYADGYRVISIYDGGIECEITPAESLSAGIITGTVIGALEALDIVGDLIMYFICANKSDPIISHNNKD